MVFISCESLLLFTLLLIFLANFFLSESLSGSLSGSSSGTNPSFFLIKFFPRLAKLLATCATLEPTTFVPLLIALTNAGIASSIRTDLSTICCRKYCFLDSIVDFSKHVVIICS